MMRFPQVQQEASSTAPHGSPEGTTSVVTQEDGGDEVAVGSSTIHDPGEQQQQQKSSKSSSSSQPVESSSSTAVDAVAVAAEAASSEDSSGERGGKRSSGGETSVVTSSSNSSLCSSDEAGGAGTTTATTTATPTLAAKAVLKEPSPPATTLLMMEEPTAATTKQDCSLSPGTQEADRAPDADAVAGDAPRAVVPPSLAATKEDTPKSSTSQTASQPPAITTTANHNKDDNKDLIAHSTENLAMPTILSLVGSIPASSSNTLLGTAGVGLEMPQTNRGMEQTATLSSGHPSVQQVQCPTANTQTALSGSPSVSFPPPTMVNLPMSQGFVVSAAAVAAAAAVALPPSSVTSVTTTLQQHHSSKGSSPSSSNTSTASTATATNCTNNNNGGTTPLRRGKWTVEEEAYVARVIQDFNSGVLNAPAGTTLRSYLSEKLHCDPMRITKKFTGDACIGKRVFHPAVRCASNAGAIDKAQAELDALEQRWRRRLEMQQRESAKKAAASAAAAAVAACSRSGSLHVSPTGVVSSSGADGGGSSAGALPTSSHQQSVVTRTASWLDRATAVLSSSPSSSRSSGHEGSGGTGNVLLQTPSPPQKEIEDQMNEVRRLIHEGPIIQQTRAGLPQLLHHHPSDTTMMQTTSPVDSTGRKVSDEPLVVDNSSSRSQVHQDVDAIHPDKRPRRSSPLGSPTGAEDAEALVGFLRSVRASAAAGDEDSG